MADREDETIEQFKLTTAYDISTCVHEDEIDLEFSRGFVRSCNYKNHKSKVKLKHRNTPERVGVITSAQTYRVEPIYDQSAVSIVKFSRIMLWTLNIFKLRLLFTLVWF